MQNNVVTYLPCHSRRSYLFDNVTLHPSGQCYTNPSLVKRTTLRRQGEDVPQHHRYMQGRPMKLCILPQVVRGQTMIGTEADTVIISENI
jgi:hypothetical protein